MEQATVPSETSIRRSVCFPLSLSYLAIRFPISSMIAPVAVDKLKKRSLVEVKFQLSLYLPSGALLQLDELDSL